MDGSRLVTSRLPAAFFNDGFLGRVRLDFSRPVDRVPAAEREAAADWVIRALATAGIVLSDDEYPGRPPVPGEAGTQHPYVTMTRARSPKAAARAGSSD